MKNQKHLERRRNIIFVYIATIFFFILSFLDLDVFLLRIPDLKNLIVAEGAVNYSPFSGRSGRSLVLLTKTGGLTINCRITGQEDKSCIAKKDRSTLLNKYAKAWFYEARIHGVFREYRLLQLEVDGQLVIDYAHQKNKYLLSKRSHNYLPTTLFIIFMVITVYIRLNDRQMKHKLTTGDKK